MRLQILQRLRDLQNKRLQIQLRELFPEVLEWEPESPVELDRRTFIHQQSLEFVMTQLNCWLRRATCSRKATVPEKIRATLMGDAVDSTVEIERWSQGHCDRLHSASFCCSHVVKAFEAECKTTVTRKMNVVCMFISSYFLTIHAVETCYTQMYRRSCERMKM